MKWRQKHGRPFSAPPTRPPPRVRPSARSHSVGSAVRVVAQHQPKEPARLLRTARRLPTAPPPPLLRTTRRLPTAPLKIFGLLCHRGSTTARHRVATAASPVDTTRGLAPPTQSPSSTYLAGGETISFLHDRCPSSAPLLPSPVLCAAVPLPGPPVPGIRCHRQAPPSPVHQCPQSGGCHRRQPLPTCSWTPTVAAPDAGHTGRCLRRWLPPPVDVVASAYRLLRVVWATPFDKGWSKAGVTEKRMLWWCARMPPGDAMVAKTLFVMSTPWPCCARGSDPYLSHGLVVLELRPWSNLRWSQRAYDGYAR
jgi:hypothetical protein